MRIFSFTVAACILVLGSDGHGIGITSECEKCLNKTLEIVNAMIEARDAHPIADHTCPTFCLKVDKMVKNLDIKTCEDICKNITIEGIINKNNTQFNYAKICEMQNLCPAEDGSGKLISANVTNSPVVSGQDIVIEGVLEADTDIGVAELIFECPTNKTTPMKQLLSPLTRDGWKFSWTISSTNVSEWKIGKYKCDLMFCSTICNSYPTPKFSEKKEFDFAIKNKTLIV